MAFPSIRINSNTGSDTLASGAGPTVAISGYFAQSSGTKIITVIGDNPDLSSVNTDGSAVLFFSGSGVRNFSKITSIDNILKTIGCEDNFNLTETAIWAIGGKRKTLDDNNTRRFLRGEAKGGWSVILETNQDLTSSIISSTVGNGTDGNFNLTASGEGIILNQTANANHITSSGALTPTAWGISNITFTNSKRFQN